MTYRVLRGVVLTAAAIAVANTVGAMLLSAAPVRGWLPSEMVRIGASLTLLLPFIIQGMFLVAQMFPGGRALVPLPARLAHDGWLLVLVLSTLPSEFTSAVGPYAWNTGHEGGSGIHMSLISGFALLVCRVVQRRWPVSGELAPVTE